jgi:quercetin dioxygenase-like cupin family protein
MNQEEINNLLALTAIAAIAPEEIQSVEEMAGSSPEIEKELRSLRETAATLAYAETPLNIPARLKQRLFNRIQQETEVADFVALRSSELKWKPHPVKGLMMAVLKIDREKREMSALIRAEVTVDYPSHRHATGEEIFMLAGELIDRGVTYQSGDYLYSKAGSVHSPSAIAGCMFFVKTSLDDKFL